MQTATHEHVDHDPHGPLSPGELAELEKGYALPRNRAERRAAMRMHPEVRRYFRPFKRAFGGRHDGRIEAAIRQAVSS